MKTIFGESNRIRLFFQRHPLPKPFTGWVVLGAVCLLLICIFSHPAVWRVLIPCLLGVVFLLIFWGRRVKSPIFLMIGLFLLGVTFFYLMFLAAGSFLLTVLFPLYLLGLGIFFLIGWPANLSLELQITRRGAEGVRSKDVGLTKRD